MGASAAGSIAASLSAFSAAVDISLDRSVYESDAAATRETSRLLVFVEAGTVRPQPRGGRGGGGAGGLGTRR